MDELLSGLMGLMKPLFGTPWVAPFLIMPALVGWAIWLIVNAYRQTSPFRKAVDARLIVLRAALNETTGVDSARIAFANNFDDINRALSEPGNGAAGLVLAWREFQESIVDETQTPIINTHRPNVFFVKSAPSQLRLTFWSNLSVGMGLVFTFLGLITALYVAQEGMASASDPSQALTELLRVASAKFFASVGGVGASLLLRRAEYTLTRTSKAKVDELCTLLERGLLYIPAQKVAMEQLAVLKEQRDQLKLFNTDFALQLSERIGGQFTQAIQPVTQSLTTLNDNFSKMSEGLGQGAAEAIKEASGGELRALGQTLAVLGEQLGTLSMNIGSSGDEAARQIRAAGEDFATAARDIRDAFDRLAGNVDGLGEKLTEQSEAAAKAQSESLDRVLHDMEATQARSSQAIQDIMTALKTASTDAALTLQQQVGQALATGVSESQALFRSALEESGEGLRTASEGLTRAVSDAADKIGGASVSFERSGEGASRTADAMSGIASSSRAVAAALDNSSRAFGAVADPVNQAVRSINDAVNKIAASVDSGARSEREALDAMKALVDQVRTAHEEAETALQSYRSRFEDVDKALGGAVVKMSDALNDSFVGFREFTTRFDSEMAGAINKLAGRLASIEDHADALDKYVDQQKKQLDEVAE